MTKKNQPFVIAGAIAYSASLATDILPEGTVADANDAITGVLVAAIGFS
ncbi:MAG: hypothetical protein ACOCXP_00270 [Candidatus Dojkabacteria bacterium]